MTFVSYAQNGEDILLNRVFRGVQNGFYVDVGAYDPVEGSITKAFYDRGWSGINIEPSAIFEKLAASRPRDINLRLVALDHPGEVVFVQNPTDAGMSHVVRGNRDQDEGTLYSVPCQALPAILATHAAGRHIDFLKIDAEGAEPAIVGGTDWRVVRPTVLVIEATRPWTNELANDAWEGALLSQGYRRVFFDGINCFYLPVERTDLLGHFALPVNVLDRYTRFDPVLERLRQENAELVADQEVTKVRLIEEEQKHKDDLQQFETRAASVEESLIAERSELAARMVELQASELRIKDLEESAEKLRTELAALRLEHETLASMLDEARTQIYRASAKVAQSDPPPVDPAADGPPSDPEPRTRLSSVARPALRHDRAPQQADWVKRLLLPFYWVLLRPIIRPVAWRVRTFMIGKTQIELAALTSKVDEILAREGTAVSRLDGVPTAEIREFGRMLEMTLLTLALERSKRSP